jgi:dienelactone hydrolase
MLYATEPTCPIKTCCCRRACAVQLSSPAEQFARRLVENGCQVLIPLLIDRQDTWSGIPGIRMTNQPHREWIYRMSFEVGRHIIGYEVQKVLAALDWFTRENATRSVPMGVAGYGGLTGCLSLGATANLSE